jgi:hypothetical protein
MVEIQPDNYLFKVRYAVWFLILSSVCGITTFYYCSKYLYWVVDQNLILERKFISTTCIMIIVSGLWFFNKVLYYSIIVLPQGISSNKLVGGGYLVKWEEIVEVKRPKFGIPYDAIYIVTYKNKKILLVRGMKNYLKLIKLIKVKAPNLRYCVDE